MHRYLLRHLRHHPRARVLSWQPMAVVLEAPIRWLAVLEGLLHWQQQGHHRHQEVQVEHDLRHLHSLRPRFNRLYRPRV